MQTNKIIEKTRHRDFCRYLHDDTIYTERYIKDRREIVRLTEERLKIDEVERAV